MAPDQPRDQDAIEQSRREFVQAQRTLAEACDGLVAVAQRSKAAAELGIEHISSGGSAAEIPTITDIAQLRADINDAFDRFDTARMETRAWTMVLSSAEGRSLSETARRFGVSRQYASKLLKDHPQGGQGRVGE